MTEESCLFCRISARKINAEIVEETDSAIAFKDIHAQAPVHILVIPKAHIASLAEVTEAHTQLVGQLFQLINRLAARFKLTPSGYRVVVNCGVEAGQTVAHLHFHLLGGRQLRWPPG
jgi:histidine triad (HIT) family protein